MRTSVSYSLELFEARVMFDRINSHSIGLPDFQRQFEWASTDVKAFLSTILAGLPSGSLMIADNSDLNFDLRPLEGAGGPVDAAKATVVLDGQQRLTALYHLAHVAGPFEYFVDFLALRDGGDVVQDDVVMSRRRSSRRHNLPWHWVPSTALKNAYAFYSWLDSQPEVSDEDRAELGEVFAERILPIDDYQIPLTRLRGELGLSVVSQVFERTNKWGQRLNAFDLLVARARTQGWSLRGAWEEARDANPELLRVFGDDGLEIVAAIGLSEMRSIRRSDLLDIPEGLLREMWAPAVDAAVGVSRSLSREGVVHPSLLAYGSVATVMMAAKLRGVSDSSILRYYWRATLNRWHEVASNTRAVRDFQDLIDGDLAGEIAQVSLAPDDLIYNTRRSSRALWAAMVSTLMRRGPDDLVTGDPIVSRDLSDRTAWTLVPFVRGGESHERFDRVPLRLRTSAQVVAHSWTAPRLRRLGISSIARERSSQLPIGSTWHESLESQLLPPRLGVNLEMSASEVVEFRSLRLLREMVDHAEML